MRSALVFIITFKTMLTGAIITMIVICLPACTNFIFHPNKIKYTYPDKFGLDYEDVFIKTADGYQIHGWLLKSDSPAKGTVYFLHGNAQNISAHIQSVYWLPEQGYDVFMIDYRGFGLSTGKPTMPDVINDINTGFSWLTKKVKKQKKPIFLFGQSLGASLGICYVGGNAEAKRQLAGVMLDAGFSNLRTIVREKLNQLWLTWPFQYPLSMLFTEKFNPEKSIQHISPVPLLIIHSDEDKVVFSSHGKALFKLAGPPKFYIKREGGHMDISKHKAFRNEMLNFMKRFSSDKLISANQ